MMMREKRWTEDKLRKIKGGIMIKFGEHTSMVKGTNGRMSHNERTEEEENKMKGQRKSETR